jgi:hypothetical protein
MPDGPAADDRALDRTCGYEPSYRIPGRASVSPPCAKPAATSTTRSWPISADHHENVHFYGTHSVDIDGGLAQLDADGYRPLSIPVVEAATG